MIANSGRNVTNGIEGERVPKPDQFRTVAVSHASEYLETNGRGNRLVALTKASGCLPGRRDPGQYRCRPRSACPRQAGGTSQMQLELEPPQQPRRTEGSSIAESNST